MLSRSVKRLAVESQWQHPSLPPVFLLPFRARLSTVSYSSDPEPSLGSIQYAAFDKPERIPPSSTSKLLPLSQVPPTQHLASPFPPETISASTQRSLSDSIRTLLPLLRAQPSHYITAHIHARPYLLTVGDKLRLPFHMPLVRPGDVLRLNCASKIGSRDYTMLGAPYLDDSLFECRAVVVGTESEPMRFLEKTKRRQRHVKTVKSKHRFTILTVKELRIKSLEEIEGERAEEEAV